MFFATCSKCGLKIAGQPDIDYQLIGLEAVCNDCYDWENNDED